MNGWLRPGSLGAGAGIGACMLMDMVVPKAPGPESPAEQVELQFRLNKIEQQLDRCERDIHNYTK